MVDRLQEKASSGRAKHCIRAFCWTVSALTLATGIATAAVAQEAEQPTDAAGVQDIVVTAQKRAQNLQSVPIAVTAVNQETLQVNRVQSVNDLTGLAPGLLSRQNAGSLGSPSFSMRGVYATASAPSQDRQISIYLDGVYVGGTRGSVFDLPDLERIEVLRGPQGTLFGRNATAGAISVVTRDPAGEFKARQEVTVGNYDQLRTRTTVDTPKIGSFSGYVTYVHDERRGDVRNVGAGTAFDYTSPFYGIGRTRSPKWLGSKNSESVFAVLRFQPSSSFNATYRFDWSDTDNTPEARTAVVNPADPVLGQLLLGVIGAQPSGGGKFGPVTLNPSNKRPKSTNNAWNQPGFVKARGHNLTLNADLSDNISLKNITAYRLTEAYGPSTIAGLSGLEFTDAARTPYGRFVAINALGAAFFQQTPAQQAATVANFANLFTSNVGQYFAAYEGNSYGKGHQWSNELQLNYDSELATVTVGGLWYQSKELNGGLPGMPTNFAFAPTPELLKLGGIQDGTSKTTSIAAYAQAEIHVTPEIDIVAGGRVTKDKKTGNLISGGTFVGTRDDGTIVGTTENPFSFKKTKPTFSIGLNYNPDRNLLVYGKYSTAFLSGGAVGSLQFQPETVRSLEGGVKADLFDRRLRVNLAVYKADYKHAQSSQSGSVVTDPNDPTKTLSQLGVVVVDNGPLKAKGFELELTAAPAEGLTFGGSVGYTDAKLTDPNPLASQGRPYGLSGVAAWVGSTYAQYETQPIFGEAYAFFRLDANYQGKYRNIFNKNVEIDAPALAPYEFAKARWILNSRIALRDIMVGSTKAEIGVWSRNLTNNRDSVTGILFGDALISSSFQPARTVGVDLIVSL